MAENNSTAEHELLKAIEGQGDAGPAPEMKPSGPDIKARILDRISSISKVVTSGELKEKIGLSEVNKALIFIAGMLIIWEAVMVLNGTIRLGKVPRFDISTVKKAEDVEPASAPLENYSQYVDVLLSRNIFMPGQQEPEQEKEAEADVSEKAEHLKLVGISWTPGPEGRYAMIEDQKVKVTYYLNEGDTISNFKIKDIKKEKVLLTYKGTEVELR